MGRKLQGSEKEAATVVRSEQTVSLGGGCESLIDGVYPAEDGWL